MLGINAKASEFHAAMGLCNLKYFEHNIAMRKKLNDLYDSELKDAVGRPKQQAGLTYNYSYYPVLLKNEAQLLKVSGALKKENIFCRRYFYPSLNTLRYVKGNRCPVSEDISLRIACLPLYAGLEKQDVKRITRIIKDNL